MSKIWFNSIHWQAYSQTCIRTRTPTQFQNTFRFVLSLVFCMRVSRSGMFILIYCTIWIRFAICSRALLLRMNIPVYRSAQGPVGIFFSIMCWYLILKQISCIIYVECLTVVRYHIRSGIGCSGEFALRIRSCLNVCQIDVDLLRFHSHQQFICCEKYPSAFMHAPTYTFLCLCCNIWLGIEKTKNENDLLAQDQCVSYALQVLRELHRKMVKRIRHMPQSIWML